MAKPSDPVPTEIQLHRQSRVLEIVFDDGARFRLPCAYLRVFSPAAEARAALNRGEAVQGKENVNIAQITPVGGYAIQLQFDDGHDTGIYSWGTLYELGVHQEANWRTYQARAAARAHPAGGQVRVRLLYFAQLADLAQRTSEEFSLSGDPTVRALLTDLRARGHAWTRVLGGAVKVAINKQFAEPDSALHDGDEVALVPVAPQSP